VIALDHIGPLVIDEKGHQFVLVIIDALVIIDILVII
jgi:hypothetical protein